MRRALLIVAIAAALAPLGASARAASVPVLVIDGRGFGHGVGMAQDGAYWMGREGATTEQILGHFYPGTALGRATGGVRVPVLDAGPAPASVVVTLPQGGEVRDAPAGPQSPGFPVRVPPGGAVRVAWDGSRYRVEPASGGPVALGRTALVSYWAAQVPEVPSTTSTTEPVAPPPPTTAPTTTAPAPTTTAAPPAESTTTTTAPPPAAPGTTAAPERASGRSLWVVPAGGGVAGLPARGRSYRGVVELTAASGYLRAVNQVDVETYLKGMGEVRDPSWPPAALRAQAIAARTYALRAMAVSGEICDTQQCQVYLGAEAEYGAMNAAVDATRERVLVHGGALASAVYSANAGGFSASRKEGFGPKAGDAPYLRPAPYLTRDPMPWSVTVALADVGARLDYPGTVTDVRVEHAGPSGRALTVALDGDAGVRTVDGVTFDAALGLRSTLFTLRIEAADEPPPPPPPAETLVQLPPDAAPRAATALPRVAPPPDREPAVPEEAAVAAGWVAFSLAAATVLAPRRRPSPSAPRTADASG